MKIGGNLFGQKDKNNTEVYCGDILEYVFRNFDGQELDRWHYIVRESINGWEIRGIEKPRTHKSLKFCNRYEVIGNIYDNPKLLEG